MSPEIALPDLSDTPDITSESIRFLFQYGTACPLHDLHGICFCQMGLNILLCSQCNYGGKEWSAVRGLLLQHPGFDSPHLLLSY